MQFTFSLINEAEAREVRTWHYVEPYEIYSMDGGSEEESLAELLERRSPYYAVHTEEGELVSYCCFGTAAQVGGNETPALYSEDGILDIGVGMRPDLTGKGLGLSLINAALDFAREAFRPRHFRLVVLTFNERAIHVYERAGFARVHVFTQQNRYGTRDFLEMRREA